MLAHVRSALCLLEITPYSCWSDSTFGLGWLRRNPSKWKRFVALLVKEIQNLTGLATWRQCLGALNPEELMAFLWVHLLKSTQWFKGLDFHQQLPLKKGVDLHSVVLSVDELSQCLCQVMRVEASHLPGAYNLCCSLGYLLFLQWLQAAHRQNARSPVIWRAGCCYPVLVVPHPGTCIPRFFAYFLVWAMVSLSSKARHSIGCVPFMTLVFSGSKEVFISPSCFMKDAIPWFYQRDVLPFSWYSLPISNASSLGSLFWLLSFTPPTRSLAWEGWPGRSSRIAFTRTSSYMFDACACECGCSLACFSNEWISFLSYRARLCWPTLLLWFLEKIVCFTPFMYCHLGCSFETKWQISSGCHGWLSVLYSENAHNGCLFCQALHGGQAGGRHFWVLRKLVIRKL